VPKVPCYGWAFALTRAKVPKELATDSADSPKGVLRKHGLNTKEIMVSNLSRLDEVNFLAKNAEIACEMVHKSIISTFSQNKCIIPPIADK